MRSRERIPALCMSFAVVALLAPGCARVTSWAGSTQVSAASMRPGDVLGISVQSINSQAHAKIAKCVGEFVKGYRVDVVPIDVPRLSDIPVIDQDWQTLAADRALRDYLTKMGVRYLAHVAVKEDVGAPTHHTDFAANSVAFVIGLSTKRSVSTGMQAVVIDVKNGRLVANGWAGADATSEDGVALVYLVVPIPYWSHPETFSKTCQRLSIEVARSLIDWSATEDGVRGCDFLSKIRDDNWEDLVKKALRLKSNAVVFEPGVYSSILGNVHNFPKVNAMAYRCEGGS